jgi:hypothetical protein
VIIGELRDEIEFTNHCCIQRSSDCDELLSGTVSFRMRAENTGKGQISFIHFFFMQRLTLYEFSMSVSVPAVGEPMVVHCVMPRLPRTPFTDTGGRKSRAALDSLAGVHYHLRVYLTPLIRSCDNMSIILGSSFGQKVYLQQIDRVRMGNCCPSLCRVTEEARTVGQFESLVLPRPNPVSIVDVARDTDSDVPLFAPAPSDDDNVEVSDVEDAPDSDEEKPAHPA